MRSLVLIESSCRNDGLFPFEGVIARARALTASYKPVKPNHRRSLFTAGFLTCLQLSLTSEFYLVSFLWGWNADWVTVLFIGIRLKL